MHLKIMENKTYETKYYFSTFRSFLYNIYIIQTSLLEANNRSSWATPSLCLWECRRYQRWIVTAAELTWLTNLKRGEKIMQVDYVFQLPCQAKQFLILRKAQEKHPWKTDLDHRASKLKQTFLSPFFRNPVAVLRRCENTPFSNCK